jgi:hydrophobe/amphiphile efflux-1 (HAE1) family protein
MKSTSLSAIFIERPILAAVLSILIFVVGLIAIPNLPVSEYPEVAPPTIQVTAIYPGANPKTIAETVAAPLEEAINGVENMIYQKSAASSDGTMILTITFKLGTDIDAAAVQVQNRVAQAQPRLPEAVRQLGVTTNKASPNITMVVHVHSPKQTYDGLYLSNFATLKVRDELARINGVGSAQVFGAGVYAMRIWLDPDRMRARMLSARDVIAAIREQNVQVSAGAINASPQPMGANVQYLVNAQGRLESPEQFGQIVLKTDAAGAITRLIDVARVELGSNTYALNSLLNNQQAAAVVIFEAPGANSIALSQAVRNRMQELAKDFPEGVSWSVVYDPTVFVRKSVESVIATLLEAIAFVVIVVIVFLQTWRASIIPLLAVPVSVVGTFAALLLLGYSVNVLTLFGLVLAIGIVVDDAIVVVENVERHIADGLTPKAAARKAMEEVTSPIIAITLVLIAVFVPLAFIGGVSGQFYQQFAVTIAVSTIISAFNSLTLSPALAAVLLQPNGAKKDRLARGIDSLFGRFFGWFNRFFARRSNSYSSQIGGTLARTPILLLVYGIMLLATWQLFRVVPGGFIPTQDKQYLFAGVQMPPGASLERTETAMRRMGELALATPGVVDVVQFPGLNAVHFVSTPNVGVMFVGLAESSVLPKPAADIAMELTIKFSEIKDGGAFALMPPPVFGYGNAAGVEMYVQDRARLGYGELNQQTNALVGAIANSEGFSPQSVFSSFQSNVPQLDADIDRDKVKLNGLQLTDVFDTLQVYLGSAYVNDLNLFGKTYAVYAQADAGFRDEAQDIERFAVRNASGEMVPLGGLVKLEPSFGPDPVVRYNGHPAADIQGGPVTPYITSEQTVALTRQLAGQVLPKGMSYEFTGLTYQQVNQSNIIWVYLLCVLLVYLVLAALFESWLLPLSVILIVPLCMFSAIAGIMLLNTVKGLWFGLSIGWGWIPPPPVSSPPSMIDLNIFTQIGLLVLMGLACKNAILIVEFARELEQRGVRAREAVIEACRLRLRPILMTSFAFIMGVVPLIIASGAGFEVRHVMGVTVFAGMLGVTFFGLYFTPVFYLAVRRYLEKEAPLPTHKDSEVTHG